MSRKKRAIKFLKINRTSVRNIIDDSINRGVSTAEGRKFSDLKENSEDEQGEEINSLA